MELYLLMYNVAKDCWWLVIMLGGIILVRADGRGRRLYVSFLIIALLMIVCKVDSTTSHSSSISESSSSPHANRFDDANRMRSMENLASAVRSSLLTQAGNRRDTQDVSSSTDNKRRTRKRRNNKEGSSPSLPNSLEERDLIVGGSTAPPGRFPYSVSLQLEEAIDQNGEDQLNNAHTCGGTLVAMDVVLTAGHCGYQEFGSAFNYTNNEGKGKANFGAPLFYGADVGAYNLQNGFSGSANEVDNLLFEKLVVHPEYTGFYGAGDGDRLQHDVMLVKLYGGSDNPVVKLHNPNSDPEPTLFEELAVIGWGDTNPEFGGEPDLPDILQYASVSYIPNDVCENFNGYLYTEGSDEAVYFDYEGKVSNDMMCAVNWDGQDACQGDSGGGLVRLGDTPNGNNDVQMGTVSWGVTCGNADFAGVYSRISEHYDWIRDNICDLSDKPPKYMNCPIKPYPPGSIYSAPVEITITIQFDQYRGEIGWLLETIPDFRNVAFRPFGTYSSITTVDENNSISETLRIQSGRFYLLTLMDEFADGFCCDSGQGFFRVDVSHERQPIVPPTLGMLWSKHAIRRAFYISEPDKGSSAFVTIVLTLGAGANPEKFLYLALENIQYEVLLLYEIQPLFATAASSRLGESESVYSLVYKVSVFDVEFGMQRYNVISIDDNIGAPKASFEVYLGDISPDNLLLAQSGNYGENQNNVARSFVLFKDNDTSPSSSLPFTPTVEFDLENAGPSSIPMFVRGAVLSTSFIFMAYAFL